VNKTILIGNLGADPEMRAMPSGESVANLRIATSERWKDKNGDRQEHTEWHRVVFFGRITESIGRYLSKGDKVSVEGRIRTRKWTDKQQIERYSTEIIGDEIEFLVTKGNGGDRGNGNQSQSSRRESQPSNHQPQQQTGQRDDFDDDIPF
jgi:single-strand DNA-binding protein